MSPYRAASPPKAKSGFDFELSALVLVGLFALSFGYLNLIGDVMWRGPAGEVKNNPTIALVKMAAVFYASLDSDMRLNKEMPK